MSTARLNGSSRKERAKTCGGWNNWPSLALPDGHRDSDSTYSLRLLGRRNWEETYVKCLCANAPTYPASISRGRSLRSRACSHFALMCAPWRRFGVSQDQTSGGRRDGWARHAGLFRGALNTTRATRHNWLREHLIASLYARNTLRGARFHVPPVVCTFGTSTAHMARSRHYLPSPAPRLHHLSAFVTTQTTRRARTWPSRRGCSRYYLRNDMALTRAAQRRASHQARLRWAEGKPFQR